jgi:hypothetical protein
VICETLEGRQGAGWGPDDEGRKGPETGRMNGNSRSVHAVFIFAW